MKTVTVYGEDIDFPDEMSDSDIESAIVSLISSGQIKEPSSSKEEIKVESKPKEKFDFIKMISELGTGLKEGTLENLKQIGADIATEQYQVPTARTAMMGGLGGYYPGSFEPIKSKEEASTYRQKLQGEINSDIPSSKSGKAGYMVSKAIVPSSAPEAGIEAIVTALTAGAAPGLSAAYKSKKLADSYKIVKSAEKTPGFAEIVKSLAKSGIKTGKTLAKGGAYLGGLKLLFDSKDSE